MSRVWVGEPTRWPDEPIDTREHDVDDLRCHRCSSFIGWWADVDDDTGRNVGGFIAYGVGNLAHIRKLE